MSELDASISLGYVGGIRPPVAARAVESLPFLRDRLDMLDPFWRYSAEAWPEKLAEMGYADIEYAPRRRMFAAERDIVGVTGSVHQTYREELAPRAVGEALLGEPTDLDRFTRLGLVALMPPQEASVRALHRICDKVDPDDLFPAVLYTTVDEGSISYHDLLGKFLRMFQITPESLEKWRLSSTEIEEVPKMMEARGLDKAILDLAHVRRQRTDHKYCKKLPDACDLADSLADQGVLSNEVHGAFGRTDLASETNNPELYAETTEVLELVTEGDIKGFLRTPYAQRLRHLAKLLEGIHLVLEVPNLEITGLAKTKREQPETLHANAVRAFREAIAA